MTYHVCKAIAYGMLLGGAFFLYSAATGYTQEPQIKDAVLGLLLSTGSIFALWIDRGVPAYQASEELRLQIGRLSIEKAKDLSLVKAYEDTLREALFFLELARDKRKHRQWRAAIHAVNLGKQKIKNYRDAAAATNADPREPLA